MAGGGALSRPGVQEATPDLVDDAGWWRVPGLSPQGVINWEKARLPRRFAVSSWGGAPPSARSRGACPTSPAC